MPSDRKEWVLPLDTQPAKSLKSNTGEVYFCLIGTQNTMPSCQKYTPPVCVFSDFAGWIVSYIYERKSQPFPDT